MEGAPDGGGGDLMAMLAGGAPPGPGPEQGPGPDQEQRSPADCLRDAIASMDDYAGVEQDDIDLADGRKIQALLQRLLAKQQTEADAAMGTTPAHRYIRRNTPPMGGQ